MDPPQPLNTARMKDILFVVNSIGLLLDIKDSPVRGKKMKSRLKAFLTITPKKDEKTNPCYGYKKQLGDYYFIKCLYQLYLPIFLIANLT